MITNIKDGDLEMNDKDKKTFLEDFKKSEISKKLDMWLFALDQEVLWEEILSEMSGIAQSEKSGQVGTTEK